MMLLTEVCMIERHREVAFVSIFNTSRRSGSDGGVQEK